MKISINLGKFLLDEHKTWLKYNPSKKPKKYANVVSHYYTKGGFCEEINAPRETEVYFRFSYYILMSVKHKLVS